ncbi:uncharacterized protein LOC131692802 [Topomyia yanbarensis]|uniref:uncharacterized protein LOC131692802 n=1 Tax=Topomyia yanbarensis TaxID=2498891 RepID=UPI00273B9AB2|nr:uncharacterized protein LOC131692802 [Topomyia yanbarensis]
MFVLLISFLTFATKCQSAPVTTDFNKTSLANIETFFENAFGDLAGALITNRDQNSTQHYQSSDGSIHADVQPLHFSPLESITFSPNHHQLTIQNKTVLFHNGSAEVELVKVSFATTVSSHNVSEINTTAKPIPTTTAAFASGAHEVKNTTSVVTTALTVNSRMNNSTSSSTVPVEIVTPESNPATREITTTTAVNIKTTVPDNSLEDEIKEQIKEIEANPVILSVIV